MTDSNKTDKTRIILTSLLQDLQIKKSDNNNQPNLASTSRNRSHEQGPHSSTAQKSNENNSFAPSSRRITSDGRSNNSRVHQEKYFRGHKGNNENGGHKVNNNNNNNTRNRQRNNKNHMEDQNSSRDNSKPWERYNRFKSGDDQSGTREPDSKKPRARLGYKRLEELYESSAEEIGLQLSNSYNGFEHLLAEETFLSSRPDWVVLITKLLAKNCTSVFPENRVRVLTIVSESNFLHCCHQYLTQFNVSNRTPLLSLETFLRDVFNVLDTLTNLLPSITKERFHDLVKNIFGSICAFEVFNDVKIENEIKDEFRKLENRIRSMESVSQAMLNKRNNHLDEGEPPDDFREISLYPTQEEILLDGEVFLRRSIVDGRYRSVEHYLDIQFRLLRQDLVAPLRTGMKELIESLTSLEKQNKRRRLNNIRLFKNCSFEGIVDIKGTVAYVVCFDMLNKLNHINWEYNRWFMYGSLLFFSFDNFSTFFMGTVTEKKSKTCKDDRVILVELIGDVELGVEDFSKECMMVESTIFFLPYYNVMRALQGFDEKNFPMSRYIVEVNPVINPPAYLMEPGMKHFKIDSFVDIDILDQLSWPSSSDLSLDKYQFEAFQSAFTKEFVVMQGPPGTGKTFLGLKIVENLLKQDHLLDHLSSPILLVCYTNHALDQFLEGILKFTTSLVRVGSQTKSELIKPYELGERRKMFKHTRSLNSAFITLKQEMEQLLSLIKSVQKVLEILEKSYGIINFDYLKDFISPDHAKQLKSSENLVSWLLLQDADGDQIPSFKDIVKNNSDNDDMDETETEIPNQEEANDNESAEDSDDEDEARKQMKNDVPLLDNIIVDKCTDMMVLTTGSLEKKITSINEEINCLERQINLVDDYNKLRWDCEYRKDYYTNTLAFLKARLKNVLKEFKIKDRSKEKSNLLKMNISERWKLYDHWLGNFRCRLMQEIKDLELKHRSSSQQFSEARQMQDLEVLQQHKILGTTTTTAAKYHRMFSALKPKIVVVEEAAEVLEAHIITALTKACQHLILIGDHQQLRPNPSVYELAKKYNLEVSLFERMISNKLSFSTLGVQHRMRPEICDLVTPAIYPKLENHPSVFDYGNVMGVTKNLFFVTHNNYEESDDIIQSYQNPHEVGFVLRLARYLLFQGYTPDEITILTTYSGQLIKMKMERKNMPELRDVRICTVDNYQGEECKIILLSLVRSNTENKIGFLSTPNRVCVALSRAKMGFYLIGNMDALENAKAPDNGTQIWPVIKKQLEMHQGIGPKLELECILHKNKTYVSTKDDFSRVPEGGCTSMCNSLLTCSHICKSLCHPRDREHVLYKCGEKCLKTCPDGHPCQNKCYESCNQCRVMVERKLDCGHSVHLQCHIDPTEYHCKVKLEYKFDICGHSTKVTCHSLTSGEKPKCPIPCESRLNCGHACSETCHLDDDPDHIEYKCMKECVRKKLHCMADHMCPKKCFEECALCSERVTKELPCGHKESVLCHIDVTYVECQKPCLRKLTCGHNCKRTCVMMCGGCSVEEEKLIPECGHRAMVKCGIEPSIKLCKNRCIKMLSCGHQCAKKCNECCVEGVCAALVDKPSIIAYCGHPTRVPCKDQNLPEEELKKLAMANCKEPCNEMLLCEHVCGGTCSDCKQGCLHVICKEKCGRVNICGHSCKSDCSTLCPPCKEPCLNKCEHSSCRNPCGQKCAPCREPCVYQCKHYRCKRKCSDFCNRPPCNRKCNWKLKCGHFCIGFCGEPCIEKCRICDKDEVTNIFFGDEDEPKARFVMLEDCGHFFESNAINKYMGIGVDQSEVAEGGNEVGMKLCPQCKTPITSTLRFMKQIKSVMNDIAQIKIKQGKTVTVASVKYDLKNRLKELKKFNRNESDNEKILKSSKYFINMNDRIYSRIEDFCTQDRNGKKVKRMNFVSQLQINLYMFIVESMETIKNRVLQIHKLDSLQIVMLLAQMDEILYYMSNTPGEKITEQQKFDILCEINRFYALANLLELKSRYFYFKDFQNQIDLDRMYDQLFAEIRCFKKYNKDRANRVDVLLDQLEHAAKTAVPRGLTADERAMIRMAMSVERNHMGRRIENQQGHWYKCSKGHFYFIGDCGGAMTTARCIECNEVIGGAGHRTVATTSQAREMMS